MLEKKENVIKNINYAEEFNEKSKEIGDWVYEHIFKEKGIGEGIIATCWDGWDEQIYETSNLIIDKSEKNKIKIEYDKRLYKEVFWFIKIVEGQCSYWNEESKVYINSPEIEDYIDLIDIIREKNEIELILNETAYNEIKEVKITLGFEIL